MVRIFYHRYGNGLSYSGIKTARIDLYTVFFLPDSGSFGNHPLVFCFLEGAYSAPL